MNKSKTSNLLSYTITTLSGIVKLTTVLKTKHSNGAGIKIEFANKTIGIIPAVELYDLAQNACRASVNTGSTLAGEERRAGFIGGVK